MSLLRESPEHVEAFANGQWCYQYDEPCPYPAGRRGMFREWCRGYAEAGRRHEAASLAARGVTT